MCKCRKKKAPGLDYCKKCFERIFEKRIRSELHNYPWFKKGEKVIFLDDESCKTEILKKLVLPLLEKARIEVKLSSKKPRKGRIISADNLEDVIVEFLTAVVENKPWKKDKIIRPLRQLTDKEINQYAKLKDLKEFKRKQNPALDLVNTLEQKHQETRFALLKSSEKLLN